MTRHWTPPLISPAATDDEKWFGRYVVAESGCWEWISRKDRDGYGSFHTDGQSRPAHRVSYQRNVGPIPDGAHIDHLCRNRGCVNPDHLEAVSPRTNILRGQAPAAVSRRTNKCLRGHEFTPENTICTNRAKGWRTCRTCVNNRLLAKTGGTA